MGRGIEMLVKVGTTVTCRTAKDNGFAKVLAVGKEKLGSGCDIEISNGTGSIVSSLVAVMLIVFSRGQHDSLGDHEETGK